MAGDGSCDGETEKLKEKQEEPSYTLWPCIVAGLPISLEGKSGQTGTTQQATAGHNPTKCKYTQVIMSLYL